VQPVLKAVPSVRFDPRISYVAIIHVTTGPLRPDDDEETMMIVMMIVPGMSLQGVFSSLFAIIWTGVKFYVKTSLFCRQCILVFIQSLQ